MLVKASSAICLFIFSSFSFKSPEKTPFETLQKIDKIVEGAIKNREFPGAQVLVIKNGHPLFNKSYGYLTYDSLQEVSSETIYDLASITKVAATTLMSMSLYEKGLIRLDEPISCYLDEYIGTNKEKITVRQLLAHNAGLRSYLPFWEQTLGGDFLETYCEEDLKDIPPQVLSDSVNNWIIRSRLGRFRGKSRYRYSDIGFLILQEVLERASGETMDDYLLREYYQPMQLKSTTFNPGTKGFPYTEIAPTEFDALFRYHQVWGEVHDRNAAIKGGVAGHAGLFSNSTDLAQLMSLFMGRSVSDVQIRPSTLEEFIKPHFPRNRRALGFDRKNDKVSRWVSEDSFGHKGFTGTMVWMEPAEDLVYVFLSNRVYPNAQNKKLIYNKTRERIQDVIYESIAQSRM